MLWPFVYAASFASACVLGCAFTAAARSLGHRFEILDHPRGRKAHAKATPITGGYGIFAAFLMMAGTSGILGPSIAGLLPESAAPLPDYLRNLSGVRRELGAILLGAGFIFLVGAVDDVRPLAPSVKLAAQFLAVAPLLALGLYARVFLPVPALGMIATALWAVFLMNSFNFIDNMDGLCATVAAVAAAVLALAAYQGGELWLPALFLSFSGALAGFLIFNFHPATIFLGDSGALMIGYLLAVFCVMTTFYSREQPTGLPVLIPAAVMGVPLFDTISVMAIRWRNGAPLMVGDRNHFSHRLLAMGFSVRQTALTIGLLAGASGLLALPLRYLSPPAALLHLFALAMLFAVIGALEFIGRSSRKE